LTGYNENIEKLTLANGFFRQVVFTGKHAQLVLMSLLPGEEIGMEVHPEVDQFFRFEKGQGKVIQNGEEKEVTDGSAVIVPAGTNHNIINTSQTDDLKLYTIYSPPNHPDGTVHKTKAEAVEAEEKEHQG
jgi:mannose-6-phosphate isomerase-like protein (cupin superfamily)